jgi:hypothetical protein
MQTVSVLLNGPGILWSPLHFPNYFSGEIPTPQLQQIA